MADLTADLYIEPVGKHTTIHVPLISAADIIYRGALVYLDGVAGGCFVTGEAAGDWICGYSPKKQTVATGDLVEIVINGACWFPSPAGLAATDTGQTLNMDAGTITDNIDDTDSQTGNALAATDFRVGKILHFTAARTLVLVDALANAIGLTGTWD